MKINLNGEEKQTDAATVRELVEELGLGQQPVAVELNRRVVPRRDHDTTDLSDGDTVELVTLVGGG